MPAPHAPRKHARQARARATQAAIVEAAARILEQGGRGDFTTNAIAARAGVSIGSLYQYFPDKQAIVAALIREKRQELVGHIRKAMIGADSLPVGEAIAALVRAGMMHQYSRPKLALELEYLEAYLGLEAEAAALTDEIAGLVLATTRRLCPDAGPTEARDVVAICKGIINAAALSGDPGGAPLIRRCVRAVTGYLAQAR